MIESIKGVNGLFSNSALTGVETGTSNSVSAAAAQGTGTQMSFAQVLGDMASDMAGALKLTLAWVLPAVAVPITGAPGTTALTRNDWLMVVAALVAALPAWSALMVQVPAVMKVRLPPLVMVAANTLAPTPTSTGSDSPVMAA